MKDNSFTRLYDTNGNSIEYHGSGEHEGEKFDAHFLFINKHDGEEHQIWVTKKQEKQLLFELLKSVTREEQ